MHPSAMTNAKYFFDVYAANLTSGIVLDIGSQDVNGSLKTVCPEKLTYVGVDFVAGKGVDVILNDPYVLPFPDNYADIIVSSSCFEHSEMFWLLFLEIMRVLKPSGLFYLNVPSNGLFHQYPVDCWRFYPDSGNALVSWAKHNNINACLLESFTSNQEIEWWNDFVAVFLKDGALSHLHPNKISYKRDDIRNCVTNTSSEYRNRRELTEDMEIIASLKFASRNAGLNRLMLNLCGETGYNQIKKFFIRLLDRLAMPRKKIKTVFFLIRSYLFRKQLPVSRSKISIIIPTLSRDSQADHFDKLKRLLTVDLPQQTHTNYEALVYCDGKNERVELMVKTLNDPRIRIFSTERTFAKWGHPQTRLGIKAATGDYFVRMNDDNKPYKRYLQALLSNFTGDIAISYARVVYSGQALRNHISSLKKSFVLPGDKEAKIQIKNIDCMNYMVRMDDAKKFSESWDDSHAADYRFIESIIKSGAKVKFIDEIIGVKR